jgi:magnesium-transporting ATPase (P-type)
LAQHSPRSHRASIHAPDRFVTPAKFVMPERVAMNKSVLKALFGFILVSLFCYTTFASFQQALPEWQGLVRQPDNWWTIATLIDAYYAFLTFYVWVFYKEIRWLPRIGWFIAIMLLGNMAMAAYVLLQLSRLTPEEPAATILARRNP